MRVGGGGFRVEDGEVSTDTGAAELGVQQVTGTGSYDREVAAS